MTMPPPRFIAEANVVNESSSTITVNKPASTAEGDTMVAFIYCSNSGHTVLTPPSGWVQEQDITPSLDSSNRKCYAYTKVAGAAEGASYDWVMNGTGSTTNPQLASVLTYRPANIVQVDNSAGAVINGSGETSHIMPTITPNSRDTMYVAAWCLNRGGSNQVQDPGSVTGMTQRTFIRGSASSGHDCGLSIYDEVLQAATATDTRTLTTTNSGGSAGLQVILDKA